MSVAAPVAVSTDLAVPPPAVAARVERVFLEREVAGGVRLDSEALARRLGVNSRQARRVLRRLRELREQDPSLAALRTRFAAVQRMTPPELAAEAERARVKHLDAIEVGYWWEAAACRGVDPEVFFPAEGSHAQAAAAKRVCAVCPVRLECLRAELATPPGHWASGIYGALTAKERTALRGARAGWGRLLEDRELTGRAHQLACRVGIARAGEELGADTRTLRRAFDHWGLPAVPSRLALSQSPRFTRQQAVEAYRLACTVGIMTAARQLRADPQTLRSAFARSGLAWPPPKRPRVRLVDPVFFQLNPTLLVPAGLSAERASARVRRQEEFEVLGARVVYALGEENRPQPQVRAWRVTERARQARKAALAAHLAARPPLTIAPTPAALEAARPHPEPGASARPLSRAAA